MHIIFVKQASSQINTLNRNDDIFQLNCVYGVYHDLEKDDNEPHLCATLI